MTSCMFFECYFAYKTDPKGRNDGTTFKAVRFEHDGNPQPGIVDAADETRMKDA